MHKIKPYGDTLNDGLVQMSFTLPVNLSDKSKEAALILAAKMGISNPKVVFSKDLTNNFSFYIVYGQTKYDVNLDEIIVIKPEFPVYSRTKIDNLIKEKLKRKIVIVGATIGTDAHTVGLDAIMNMKGYKGEYGLERYEWIQAYNLGSQVEIEYLVDFAKKVNADVLLISQIVTQKNIHIKNLTQLVDYLESENLRDKFILIVGGPSIDHKLAKELGYDAGFGKGTLANEVASFTLWKILKEREI